MFSRAIVRPPAATFAEGLTTSSQLGTPDLQLALQQHTAYCETLKKCGLTLTELEPNPNFPDATFVEDTAVLTERCAIIALPGALSRRGEVVDTYHVLLDSFPKPFSIQAPGTLDGGDVCHAGDHFFIGLSERTNETGAQQLAGLLALFGYSSSFVDIREMNSLLHLKSGLAYLGDNCLLVTDTLAEAVNEASVQDYEFLRVSVEDQYAANCIRVNDLVFVAAGFPNVAQALAGRGYQTVTLEMSEFQKMDGGLSCLSLRF